MGAPSIPPPAPAVSYSSFARTIAALRRTAYPALRWGCRSSGLHPDPPTVTANNASAPGGQTLAHRWQTIGATGPIRFLNGRTKTYSTAYVRWHSATLWTTGGNTGDGQNNTCGRAEFMADAAAVTFRFLGSALPYRFLVDDLYVDMTGHLTTVNTGTQYMTLDFASAGGRALRKIAIEVQLDQGIDGVYVGATESIFRTDGSDILRAVVIGDSHTAGTGATHAGDAWSIVMGDALGIRDIRASGVGSSGYDVANASNYKIPERIQLDAIDIAPDIVFLAGGANDTNGAPFQAAALSTIQTIRAALPECPIFVMGPVTENDSANANRIAVEAALGSIVAGLGDRKTI
jgi:lysophospholipase L1-like esterase